MAGDAPTSCQDCRFWAHRGSDQGLCRRHAPSTSERQLQVARWAETIGADSCGEGEPAGDGIPRPGHGQSCRGCLFWFRPGQGIDPALRGDHLAAWWRDAGLCRRFAPRPGVAIGSRTFWCATHAADHCFDGRWA